MSEETAKHSVSRAESEGLIASLQELPGANRDGFFGLGSITWQVNRESAVFLGAGRAALLQLAHPWVATALVQHSNLLNDAVGRFHSTFRVIYTMLFGTRRQAVAAARQLYQRHTGIRGELPQAAGSHAHPEHYEANEIAALRWVYTTLVDSAMLAYEFVLPPLIPAQREHYYTESKLMAALFGIPAAALPADWNGFAQYTGEMFASSELHVGEDGARLGRSVLAGAGTWLRPPHWYHALTASWMPPRLRTGFGLAFTAREERAVARARRWLPRIYSVTPPLLRYVGPYHEAHARLRGSRPGMLVRRSNMFWMGQPQLLHAGLAEDQ